MSTSNGNESSSELAAGRILQDRYRVIRPLGKGGMGAVYEALDLRLDTTVALKETFSTDDHLRKQFEREARMLAHLNHPSLPRVTDYFNEGDRAFLVMEFIDGVDLAKIIVQQPGPFPLASVVAWADQLLDALIYLHSRDRQVIHRDIKPHNLKLKPHGQIALLDFGLAKAQQSKTGNATSSAAIFGYTKQYAPLEQIQDLATGPRSDIYALGATLYHLLTGIKPPDALTRAAALVQSRPDPLRPAIEVHCAIGPEITAILKRAMAQSPEDRYESARDFRDALRRVGRTGLGGQTVPAEGSMPKPEPHFPEAEASALPSSGNTETESPAFLQAGNFEKGYTRYVFAAIMILLVAALAVAFLRPDALSYPSATLQAKDSKAEVTGAAMRVSKPLRSLAPRNDAEPNGNLPVPAAAASGNLGKEEARTAKPEAQATNMSPTSTETQPSSTAPRAAQQGLKAPNIYLPNPDLSRNYQAPVPASLTMSRSHPVTETTTVEAAIAPAPAEVREAQILRARDGTQIVKLPDGSARVYRPGERSAHSTDIPQ